MNYIFRMIRMRFLKSPILCLHDQHHLEHVAGGERVSKQKKNKHIHCGGSRCLLWAVSHRPQNTSLSALLISGGPSRQWGHISVTPFVPIRWNERLCGERERQRGCQPQPRRGGVRGLDQGEGCRGRRSRRAGKGTTGSVRSGVSVT